MLSSLCQTSYDKNFDELKICFKLFQSQEINLSVEIIQNTHCISHLKYLNLQV